MANGIGITRGVDVWNFQSSFVEREMDNSAYTVAHADDSLVLAGPARMASLGANMGRGPGIASLLAIGATPQISFSSSKPTQPLMAIGSGRSFYVSGKSQTQWNMSRLWMNGRNLLRVLYHSAIASGIDVSKFDDPVSLRRNGTFFINLDSELFYIPFGFAVLMRSKAKDPVASFYVEAAMVNSWGGALTAGGSSTMESVSGVADRLLPFDATGLATGSAGRPNAIPRATLDAILDFTNPLPTADGELEDDTGLLPG